MVYSGVAEERRRVLSRESMAMGSERSKPLHDFALPCLRWGNQKYLRCMKVESGGEVSGGGGADRRSPASRFADSSGSRRREAADYKRLSVRDSERRAVTVRESKSKFDSEEGIEAVREKLTLDLKTAANKMKDAILRKGEAEKMPLLPPAGEARPWNLRTRRAACKEPFAGAKAEERSTSYSPVRIDGGGAANSARPRESPEKRERAKFSVSLSRNEIEDDYAAMLGQRPPRRPKKRAKIVQKQLDSLFPGLWLSEVSEDMYKVEELPENRKR